MSRFAPHALMLLMIAIWGASYAAVKDALAHLAPFPVVAIRFWLALLCLLPVLCSRGSARDLRAAARPGLLTGTALATGYLLQTVGMRETTTSMGGFLAGLIPLLVALGGWLLLGARLGRCGAIGLALGFSGMTCLVWPDAGSGGATTNSARGIALQVGSSICYAAHVLLLSHHGRRAPAMAFCGWQVAVTAVAASVACAVAGEWSAGAQAVAWDVRLWFDLLYLGVVATALGIAVQSRAQPKIPPMHVALLFATQPLFAAVAGYAVFRDAMSALQLGGGALIVAGIVVTGFDRGNA